jgi:Bacteriophage Sf6, terminase small subunit-like
MPAHRKYSQQLGEQIAALIVEGLTLRQIGPQIGVAKRTILRWLAKEPEFRRIYSQAYELWAEAMAHEIIDIANDGSNDWIDRELSSGRIERVVGHEHVHRSKLRIDSIKWLMAHRAPKRWGDLTRHTGPQGDDPVQVQIMSDEERQRRAREEIDQAFPERSQDDRPQLPPQPAPPEQEQPHAVREFAKDGPLEADPDVAKLPVRYPYNPRPVGSWSG